MRCKRFPNHAQAYIRDRGMDCLNDRAGTARPGNGVTFGIRRGTRIRHGFSISLSSNISHIVLESKSVKSTQSEAFNEFFSGPLDYDYAQRNCLTGTSTEIQERVSTYERIGVDNLIVCPVVSSEEALLEQLDRFSRVLQS